MINPQQVPLLKGIGKKNPLSITERMQARRSKEIVIAFCGPVGSNITNVIDALKNELLSHYDYEVEVIKVSDLIKSNVQYVLPDFNPAELSDPATRYKQLQHAGNQLRHKYGHEILGQFITEAISVNRETRTLKNKTASSTEIPEERQTHRVAYLIDSLKHPAEVDILRAVYRHMFYLFGIFCPAEKRRKHLIAQDMKSSDAEIIMENDKKQDADYGQQLMKTLQYADFFINSDNPNPDSLKIKRYIDLILGTKVTSPTRDEYAMYVAQSAALRSGCLSRQIGAAILSDEGEIISIGYNDVPKKGGGIYSCEDAQDDLRCINMGNECQSDKYKLRIRDKIKHILTEELDNADQAQRITDRVANETRIKDLIEFSRAVHAEMEAIMSAARIGVSPKGGILYCTTFPCHNCARHIVAAGIKKVLFIEPYEKSLAMTLHGDSIVLDQTVAQNEREEVVFSHFEGVAPRQYLNVFQAKGERKSKGKGIITAPNQALPVLPEYLDPWTEVEAKVVEDLKQRLQEI